MDTREIQYDIRCNAKSCRMRVKVSDGKWSASSEFPVSSMTNFMALLIAERIVSNKAGDTDA
jgi:hypothetical protein